MAHETRAIPDLTRAIASGDPEAFAVLYEGWFDRMYADARRVTRADEATCLDIVQEAMLRVIRGLPVLETEAALAVWLRRAVFSCACDHFRAEQRRRKRERAAQTRTRNAPDVDVADRLADVRQALRELDDESAAIVALRHGAGLTLARIGAAFGLSTGAVDRRLRQSLGALRRRIVEVPDEPLPPTEP